MPLVQDTVLVASVLREKAPAMLLLALVVSLMTVLYRLYFHPLSHLPGPLMGRATSLYIYVLCYMGVEGRVLRQHHQKYNTKVLRVAPNSVSISDNTAVRNIYVTGGGFQKDSRYMNFNLGDVISISSALDTEYRDERAKAVAPLFAPARLRLASEPNGVLGACVAEFVKQFQEFRTSALARATGEVRADILDLCARLSIDVVTGYLLNESYGGLREHTGLSIEARQRTKLSANPFISAVVAFSRFSLLPNWLFRLVYAISSYIRSNDSMVKAFARLDRFADQIVKTVYANPSRVEDTYHGRLLNADVPPAEVVAQSKAIIFAGADSTAVMLATTLFHLVQNVDARSRLRHEIRSLDRHWAADSQALPYLRAVVKEGLRLGMANPTRFTRVVPRDGLRVGTVNIPPGTVVGCAPYMLHHDPEVFPDPFRFHPERWLEDGQDNGLRRPNMESSLIPFRVGLRACIGKNLAQQQMYESITAVVDSGVLEGARTCQERIELIEWFNGEIKGHKLEIEWPAGY